jgi:hypothetical protein
MIKCRLLARAQMNGEVKEPGHIFYLQEGERGPHRTVVSSNHGAQIADHLSQQQQLADEPLYQIIEDDDAEEAKADDAKPESEHHDGA